MLKKWCRVAQCFMCTCSPNIVLSRLRCVPVHSLIGLYVLQSGKFMSTCSLGSLCVPSAWTVYVYLRSGQFMCICSINNLCIPTVWTVFMCTCNLECVLCVPVVRTELHVYLQSSQWHMCIYNLDSVSCVPSVWTVAYKSKVWTRIHMYL